MKHVLLEHDVFRPPEFAALIGVSKPTITNWIRLGKLKAHHIGDRWYIPAFELDRIKNEMRHC